MIAFTCVSNCERAKKWKTSFFFSLPLSSKDLSLAWRSSFSRKLQFLIFLSGKFTEGRETERRICECILNFSEQLYIYKWKLWKAFKKLSVEARKINFILISERLSPYLYSLLKVLTETLHRGKFLFPTSLLRIKPLRRCTVIQHLNALIVKSYRKHLISCFYNFCKFSRVYFLFTATQISLLLYNSYLETCF